MHRKSLSEYRNFFNLTIEQFIALNNVEPNRVHKNLQYEKIDDVTRIDLAENAFFFFKGGRLAIIYISNEMVATTLWKEFMASPLRPKPEETVRSRAGKTSNQLIFASHGLTASVKNNEVEFLEIYQPCSVKEYLEKVYDDPGRFIR